MAFIDELRGTPQQDPHLHENGLIRRIILSVRQDASDRQRAGVRAVTGYVVEDEESAYIIMPPANTPPYYFRADEYDWKYLEEHLRREISQLGFTTFQVRVEYGPVMARRSFELLPNRTHYYLKQTREMGYTVFIDIRW